MNREGIDEVFEIYIFNLVNSGMDIKFMNVGDLIYGNGYIVDWVTATAHDEYLREKLDIENEDERKIKMGLDICDNGTYWGFPIRYSELKDHYAIYGGIHRFHSLVKINKLKLRDLSNRTFLCYDVNYGRNTIDEIFDNYKDIMYNNYMNDNYLDKLQEWEDVKNDYLDSYYIIRKDYCIHSEKMDVNEYTKINFTTHLTNIVGEFSDDYYIIKSVTGLDFFNDILTSCKNDINDLNKKEDRVHPHNMVRYEDEYSKYKNNYTFNNFFEKYKDKIRFY